MSKFTPGPYVVVDGDTYIGVSMGSHTKNPSAYRSKHLWCCNLQHDDEEALATATLMADAPSLLKALEKAVAHIERNTCLHEETYRDGAIWEICHQCGAKWADDEGGKPEFKWPEHVEQARALIAKHKGEKL